MEEKLKCLYYIKDSRSDKIIYVGQTINYIHRKYIHFGHKTQPIDKYMFDEGRENFTMDKFDIDISELSDEEILKIEDELILKYNTIEEGYNINRSGLIMYTDGYNYRRGKEYSEKHREKKNEYNREYLKKYREDNREKINEYAREYRLRKKLNITK